MSNVGSWVSSRNSQYNPYCFRAYDSGGTTLSDGIGTKVNLATEEYDYNSNFTGSTYTCPVAGVYHFDGRFSLGTTTGASLGVAFIYKNGSGVLRGGAYLPSSNFGFAISGDLLCAAGDTIELYGFQDSGGNEATTTGSAETFLSGHLVHRTA